MKPVVAVSLALVVGVVSSALAVESSAEYYSEFNKYMNSRSGFVDLFSGTSVYETAIASLDGAGAQIGLNLSYSGNVYTNARAVNSVAPTSWVGLGWQMGVGSIVADHKGTTRLDDDEYYLQSPTAGSQRILSKDGNYFLEHSPYWIVVPTIEGSKAESKITSWKLVDTDGTVYRYGGDTEKATRYTIGYSSGYIGSAFTGGTPYPCQWDLAQVVDYRGANPTTFTYDQVVQSLNSVSYTQASYLETITKKNIGSITFTVKDKNIAEMDLVSPDLGARNAERITTYETKLLDNVAVKTSDNVRLKTVEFAYGSLGEGKQKKSILKTITVKDADNSVAHTTKLFYDTAEAKYYGALDSVATSTGLERKFVYKKESISEQNLRMQENFSTTSKNPIMTGGTLSDGREFYLLTSGGSFRSRYLEPVSGYDAAFSSGYQEQAIAKPGKLTGGNHSLELIQWDGGEWVNHKSEISLEGISQNRYIETTIGSDCIVFRGNNGPCDNGSDFAIYRWNQTKWEAETVVPQDLSSLSQVKQILMQGDQLLILTKSGLWALHKTPTGWSSRSNVATFSDTTAYLIPGDGFVVIASKSEQNLTAPNSLKICWNTGTDWITKSYPSSGSFYGYSDSSGNTKRCSFRTDYQYRYNLSCG